VIPAPDLLHPEPRLWVDAAELRQVLTFAFASGCGSDAFEHALERTRAAPSRFVPDCFAKDLFIEDFVARCVPLRSGKKRSKARRGALVALLTQPPPDLESVRFRHEVLRELDEAPELRAGLEQAVDAISELFALMESVIRGKESASVYRRIEILRSVKQAFDAVAAAVPSSRSGLGRLQQFGKAVQESEAYRHLSELLEHEAHLASIDVRIRLGQDGRIRRFEIVSTRENHENRLHRGPLGRFFMRLRLFFLGYRLRQAELTSRLINTAFEGLEEAVVMLFQVRRDAEFYLAALGLKDLAAKKGLAVCLPRLSPPEASQPLPESRFAALYNPLLLLEERAPRPTDLSVGGSAQLVVTGPNSGGKTRLLQAIGLAQLLAQAGFFVPAASAELVLRDGLFVSVVEEATADAREGRLGTELLRIRRLFERLSWGSLVIVDELCSGTNPSEAEEIFDLVLSQLGDLEPQTIVTTHFLHFAARLERERTLPRLEFLQVELDQNQTPTFGFVQGVATTSLARRTAERLGVTREALKSLVDEARRDRGPRVAR
jgi:DNA mismatch repair protein MutS2